MRTSAGDGGVDGASAVGSSVDGVLAGGGGGAAGGGDHAAGGGRAIFVDLVMGSGDTPKIHASVGCGSVDGVSAGGGVGHAAGGVGHASGSGCRAARGVGHASGGGRSNVVDLVMGREGYSKDSLLGKLAIYLSVIASK